VTEVALYFKGRIISKQ